MPSSSSPSTTLVRPAVYNVGVATFDWKDTSRSTYNPLSPDSPIPGRVLTTQVRYPTVKGSASAETPNAAPATADGPFPVIVFAHGYDLSPDYYLPLIDTWVHAGFVVVSPIFPDENTVAVNRYGGPDSSGGVAAENDVINEPGDITFVLKQFDLAAEKHSGSVIAGVANTSDVALAGQSDGANVVAALEFGSAFAAERAELKVAPKAVAILSGQSLVTGASPPNTYSSSSTSPPVLQVQSDSDTCNGTQYAANLFGYLGDAPLHLFVYLHGATHLDPYQGVSPWAPTVEKMTTQYFELELGWNDKSLTAASLEATGVTAYSKVLQTVDQADIASALTEGNCAGQLPVLSSPDATTTTTTPAGGFVP